MDGLDSFDSGQGLVTSIFDMVINLFTQKDCNLPSN
jgi:hypothetical protein